VSVLTHNGSMPTEISANDVPPKRSPVIMLVWKDMEMPLSPS